MRICEYPDCGAPSGNRGTLRLCNAHQQRKRLGLPMDAPIIRKPRGTPLERALRRMPDTFGNECVEWAGDRNDAGYATVRAGGRRSTEVRVSRLIFEHYRGPLPPDHRLIRHTCDNPPCVNPLHLISGTDADNMTDKRIRGRASKKLTPEQVQAIRLDPRGSTTVGREHGVSAVTIRNVRARRTWAHVS